MAIYSRVNSRFAAGNYAPIVFSKDNYDRAILRVQLQSAGNSMFGDFTREFFPYLTTFDISKFSRRVFRDFESLHPTQPFITSLAQYGNIATSDVSSGSQQDYLVIKAINAVRQQYGTYDMSTMFQWITDPPAFDYIRGGKEPRYRKYAGFPLYLSVIADARLTFRANGATIFTTNSTPNSYPIINIIIPDNEYTAVDLLRNGSATGEFAYINQVCVPKNPYYVRWINTNGGWNYFMFSKKWSKIITLSNVETYISYSSTIATTSPARGLTNIYQGDGLEQDIVGMDRCTADEFNMLKSIVMSPFIHLYHQDTDSWERIYLDGASATHLYGSTFQEIELTFNHDQLMTQW